MKKFLITLTILAFWAGINLSAQNTAGTVTFSVTTASNGGQYSPKNIVAIWIKNSSGTFVKTLKVMAAQRIQYLYKWKASSSSNTVGAITGATLSSHITHNVSWNVTNVSGSVVPDGTYQVWIEFTDADAQGPYTSYSFVKGTTAVDTAYANVSKFSNAHLTWTPTPTGINGQETQPAQVIQSDYSSFVVFRVPEIMAQNAQIRVFDLTGKEVLNSFNYIDTGSGRVFWWDINDAPAGIYVYRIESGADNYTGKFFKTR